MEPRHQMELPEDEIRSHYSRALALLTGFDHVPRIGPSVSRTGRRTPSIAGAEGVHLLERIENTGGDDLLSPAAATVARALRRAIAIALAVADEVGANSGAAELNRLAMEAGLSADRRQELAELQTVQALALLSVCANALGFLLAGHASDLAPRDVTLSEVLTDNPQSALHGALWELDRQLALEADDDTTLIATALAWAEALSHAIALRAETAPGIAAFTKAAWRVAADDFVIAGLRPPTRSQGKPLTMSFKRPDEVIGNAVAKHNAIRLARMMVAYDVGRQMNPFVELGGFTFTFLGDGRPGTGKTTLIRMMAGLLHEYCAVAGHVFRYRNLSPDNIDSYQGRSGQNARSFINAVTDPAVIGFGTIDDIDQIAGRRGDRQSSSGQQEITAVLMDAFAGASTVVRGNCAFGMFSNHAENIDAALRQRASARFLIEGPQSQAEYTDILALLLGPHVNIPAGGHDPTPAHVLGDAVADGYAGHSRPAEAMLAAIFDQVEREFGPLQTLADLGHYLHAIARAEPRFTGRAVKNITDAVKARAMDFDMPEEWFQRPEPFLQQPYARKMAMIAELRRPITADMVVQEINRYADSEFRYAQNADERAIEDALRDMTRMAQAQRRFAQQQ